MADNASFTAENELPPLPGIPWLTMFTALLVLFVFAGLVAVVLDYSKEIGGKTSTALSGEQQLQELRAAEKDRLETSGYDPQTKAINIPIERAMNILIDEAKTKGEMQSFPAAPKEKSK